MFDPMADLTGGIADDDGAQQPQPQHQPSRGPRRDGNFAEEVHSVTIHARQRTFYVDLKKSGNGMFFKVSEKSRGGQKTTIMFDAEDLDKFIEAFQEMKSHL